MKEQANGGSTEMAAEVDKREPTNSEMFISYQSESQGISRLSPSLPSESHITPFVLKAVSIASLGGILFGYDMGVISGALPQITDSFGLTNSQSEMVVSFLYLGGGIGATVGGTLCDTMGRRTAILVTDVVFIVGAAMLYWAWSLRTILIGRMVVGFGVAVSGLADVAYIHEISPSDWRGSVVSVNEACISLGFLLAYLAGYFIDQIYPEEGWRSMFGLGAVVAFVQFLGMLGMPESPQWLRQRGKIEEAVIAQAKINGGQGRCSSADYTEVDESNYHIHIPGASSECARHPSEEKSSSCSSLHQPIQTSEVARPNYATSSLVQAQTSNRSHGVFAISKSSIDSQRSQNVTGFSSLMALVRTSIHLACSELSIYSRQASIAVFLSLSQQFCGNTNVLNYAPEIFQQIGLTSHKSILGATLILGLIKFSVTCLVIWKIERLGRRFLLLLGMSTISLSLAMLCFAFRGSGGDYLMSTTSQYMALFGSFGVTFGYSASFGPLTWLLTSEMFPTSVRGRALGASTVITYLGACVVSYTFLSVQEMFGPAAPFAIYCVITLASLVFAALAIPDTGGRSPEQIEAKILNMWLWR